MESEPNLRSNPFYLSVRKEGEVAVFTTGTRSVGRPNGLAEVVEDEIAVTLQGELVRTEREVVGGHIIDKRLAREQRF